MMSDEEEKDNDRRISPRKRKRVQYIMDDVYYEGEEDDDDDSDEEDNNDKKENEKPGPSTQSTHNQRTHRNRLLTVTCGNKTGLLDVKKLESAEECIESEGRWFLPPAFEEFGGKGTSKKWKASIFCENKPLQFWFEQGSLTTKGFKRKRTASIKHKKVLSSNPSSESSSEESEIQIIEETEEEDGKDEDWLPSSEELVLETAERVEREIEGAVIDSGMDTSKEDENKTEKGEMEDEDMPDVADNDGSVSEEREPNGAFVTPERSALQKDVKVVIKRLPEVLTDCQSSNTESQREDGLDVEALNVEDVELENSTIDDTADTCIDPIQTSDSSDEENWAKITQGNQRKNDGHRDNKGERENSEDMSRSEATDKPFATGNTCDAATNTSPIQRGIKEESIADMYGGSATKSQGVLDKYQNRDATTSSSDTVESQVMKLKTRVSQITRASKITQTSNMVEVPSCRPSTSSDLSTMDLDQLRREKLRVQIKVLRLQEEYYALKIERHKK